MWPLKYIPDLFFFFLSLMAVLFSASSHVYIKLIILYIKKKKQSANKKAAVIFSHPSTLIIKMKNLAWTFWNISDLDDPLIET